MANGPSAFSFPRRISEKRPLKRPVPGLGIVSAAPSASAATVCSAPSSASEETIMIFGPARRRENPGDGLQSARAGHFQVEEDDIDAAFAERFDGRFGGAGDRGDLEGGIVLDHARKDRPGDRRIVDDHQADRRRRIGRGSGRRSRDLASARSTAEPQATPTS